MRPEVLIVSGPSRGAEVRHRRPPLRVPLADRDAPETRVDQRALQPVDLDKVDVRLRALLPPELLRPLVPVRRPEANEMAWDPFCNRRSTIDAMGANLTWPKCTKSAQTQRYRTD
jgi:hypothetical protein